MVWVSTRMPSCGHCVLPSTLGKPVPGMSSQPEVSSHRGVGGHLFPTYFEKNPRWLTKEGATHRPLSSPRSAHLSQSHPEGSESGPDAASEPPCEPAALPQRGPLQGSGGSVPQPLFMHESREGQVRPRPHAHDHLYPGKTESRPMDTLKHAPAEAWPASGENVLQTKKRKRR